MAAGTKTSTLLILGLSLLLTGGLPAQQQQPGDIPDAPSATRPIPPPASPSPREQANQPDSTPPDTTGNGVTTGSHDLPHSATDVPESSSRQAPTSDFGQSSPPPPMPPIKTVPAGSVPKDKDTGEDVGFTIRTTANLVLVPVTVKDHDGRMVNGLQPNDFVVLENGQKQTLKFFTSDPFALSAAVIIDLGMPDVGVQKVQQTLPALEGAFSQFDEVAIYTYSSTVGRATDFTRIGQQLTATLNQIRSYRGTNNGPPVTSGPLGPQGPMINGLPVDTPITPISTPPKVAHVLNDAILMAARDLAKRDRTHRKIIFIISDGREQGSTASYKDTLKVLQTQQITVYAVGLEGAAEPGYGTLERIHLPKTRGLLGYGDILPKYVSATGGGTVYNELTESAIERAYSAALGDSRNQYTLGYSSKGIGGYRQIEVRVRRPEVKVYARDGYYPLPTAR